MYTHDRLLSAPPSALIAIVRSQQRRSISSLLFPMPAGRKCFDIVFSISAPSAHTYVFMQWRERERETGSYLAAARRVCVALHHTQVSRLSSSEFVIMREREERRRERERDEYHQVEGITILQSFLSLSLSSFDLVYCSVSLRLRFVYLAKRHEATTERERETSVLRPILPVDSSK